MVQPDTSLHSCNSCSGAMFGPSHLDNRISTPLPDQLVGSDNRHGYLTGRCGRCLHIDSGATRTTAHGCSGTGVLLCRVRVPATALRHHGRIHCSLCFIECSFKFLAVRLTVSRSCTSILFVQSFRLHLQRVASTSTHTSAVVQSSTYS